MRKALTALTLCLMCGNVFGNTDPDVILYQVADKTYFVTGDVLEQLKDDARDTCLEHVIVEDNLMAVDSGQGINTEKTTTIKFYELLLSQCRQQVSNLIGGIKNDASLFNQSGVSGELVVNDDVVAAYVAGRKNARLKNTTPDKLLEKYNTCVVLKQDLQQRLKKYEMPETVYSYNINADIDKCIKSIDVQEGVDVKLCPLNPTISDKNDIAGMENFNERYLNKKQTFSAMPDVVPGQIALFNGRIMVVCDQGQAVYVVKPAFSGYAECRDARYQSYPNVGALPDGVYLVKHDAVEKRKDTDSWGGYRAPLMPSQETQTYGRENFYLHGTSDAHKQRSGGCISLGVQIEEFIESDWFQNSAKDLIIIVDKYN